MRTGILAEAGREATAALPPQRVAEAARRQLDVRRRTITTAVAWAAHEQFATLEVGDEIEQRFRVDPDRLAFGGVVVCEYLTFMEVCSRPTCSSLRDGSRARSRPNGWEEVSRETAP